MKTRIVPRAEINEAQRTRMFQVLTMYYDHISRDQFEKDLSEKSHVILLIAKDEMIHGFSTILNKPMVLNGKKIMALYSGDTVLDRDHWGNGALGLAFGKYLMRVKLKNLSTPVYWFLISKGYKTYLLMANNFPIHYPRWEKPTPQPIGELMAQFYSQKFGERYHEAKGLIVPRVNSTALKVSVADIDQSLLRHPRIAFFADKNSEWQRGQELTCVAEVNLWVPVRYVVKRLYRKLSKPIAQKEMRTSGKPHSP